MKLTSFAIILLLGASTMAAEPWTETVKYEANHAGQIPFTVESVNAYRVPSGKLVISKKQTKIFAQPGDKVTLGDGTVLVIKTCDHHGEFNYRGTIIHDPIPKPQQKPPATEKPKTSPAKK